MMDSLTKVDSNHHWDIWKWHKKWNFWQNMLISYYDNIYEKVFCYFQIASLKNDHFWTLINYHLNTWGVMKLWFSESTFNLLSNITCLLIKNRKNLMHFHKFFFTNILSMSHFGIPVLHTLTYILNQKSKAYIKHEYLKPYMKFWLH